MPKPARPAMLGGRDECSLFSANCPADRGTREKLGAGKAVFPERTILDRASSELKARNVRLPVPSCGTIDGSDESV